MYETTLPPPVANLRGPRSAQSTADLADRLAKQRSEPLVGNRLDRVNESRADGLPAWAPQTPRTMQPWALRAHRPKLERLPPPVQFAPQSMATERPHAFDMAAMDDAALLVAIVGCSRETALKWIGAAGSLARLSRFDIDDLIELSGMTESEAKRVLAAGELGRRGLLRESRPEGTLYGAAEIARWFKLRIGGQFVQDIWVVGIDDSRGLHGVCRVSHGDVHGETLDPGSVVTAASRMHVKRIALVHNHPSGDVSVTAEDMRFVMRVHRAVLSARMKLADVILVGPRTAYSSMAEQGTLPGFMG